MHKVYTCTHVHYFETYIFIKASTFPFTYIPNILAFYKLNTMKLIMPSDLITIKLGLRVIHKHFS